MVIVIEHRRCLAGVLGVVIMLGDVGIRVVLMLVVPKMMRLTLSTFVQAVRFHGSPNGLERQQDQQENGDQSTHGNEYIGIQNKI
ncbi:MAG: hypothetical protein RI920_2452 [Pseudomonadota bacterium]|jgi:hypothetical protein